MKKNIYFKNCADSLCAVLYIKMAIDQYYNSQHPGPLKIYRKKSCDWL